MKLLNQLRGLNPFKGDIVPSRLSLFKPGRPSLPFPHPWNYHEPLRILDSFYFDVEDKVGSAKHNRYVDIPGLPYVLVTREPAVIKAILLDSDNKPGQFDRDTSPAAGIARATGEDTLLYANRDQWRNQKKVAASPFTRSSLFQAETFAEFESTFRATARQRLELLRQGQAERGEEITRMELEPEVQAVMLEMLVTNFFGTEVPYKELRDTYVPAITRLIDFMVSDTVIPRSRNFYKRFGARGRLLRSDAAQLRRLTELALLGRQNGTGLWPRFKSDVPDEKLVSNIRVFLAGALEATSSFATWAISHLSRRTDLQERIFEETKDLDEYNPENLEQARTLNLVLEETLRLTPSLYFLPRRATEHRWIETDDKRRMMIPSGTHIVLDIWNANRCEEFWGKQLCGYPATTFAPERWEELQKQGKKPKETLHFGFGHGPRVCPGKFLGYLEVGLVVAAVVKLFTFKAVNENATPRAGVSTKPADGVLVDLKLRD